MNKWFSHGQPLAEFESFEKQPEDCCSKCMESCIERTQCEMCSRNLTSNAPKYETVVKKDFVDCLKNFLLAINVNDHVSAPTPSYCEENLASAIIENISKFHLTSDALDFLKIFNFDHETNVSIIKFVVKNFKDFSSDNLVLRKNLQVKILISVSCNC